MVEKKCLVSNPLGIHARPSALIVTLVRKELTKLGFKDFDGKIFIRRDNASCFKCDASSIMDIMMLAAVQGTKLVVFCDNHKFKGVVEALAKLINEMENFEPR